MEQSQNTKKIFYPSFLALKLKYTVSILMIFLIILGFISYNSLPKEWQPDVQIPFLIVVTPFPGASPEDVENIVTFKLEKKLAQLSHLKKISSSSSQGASIITLEYEVGFDINEARSDAREAVDEAKVDFPDDVKDAQYKEVNLSESPIITINIAGKVGLFKLKQIAEEVKEEIEGIPGVLTVERIGGLEKEVQVNVDSLKLNNYQFDLSQITRVIHNENKDIPTGKFKNGSLNTQIRVPGTIKDPDELNKFIINSRNGQAIYLEDIADIEFGYKELQTRSRSNGVESVSITVSKRSGENLNAISNKTKAIIDQVKQKYGKNIQFTFISDKSIEVNKNISDLENNIYTGIIFVIVGIFLFLGLRNAIIIGLSIPLSMLVSFFILDFVGITLNMVVLFSLILSLGMLVDNAIVIVENIYRHLQLGKKHFDAALDGVSEVAFPVIASTLTTLAAFFPLIFMPGIIGDFMKYLPITLIITLSSSLFVGLVFNVLICSVFLKKPKNIVHSPQKIDIVSDSKFIKKFSIALQFCMKHNFLTIIFVFSVWFGILFIFNQSGNGTDFFPKGEPSEAIVNIKAPSGTNLDESNKIVKKIETVVNRYSEHTQALLSNIGMTRNSGETSNSSQENSHILLVFPNWHSWKLKPSNVLDNLRNDLHSDNLKVAGAKVSIAESQHGPPTGKAINIEVKGNDLPQLKFFSNKIQKEIKKIEGIINIDDDLDLSSSQVIIDIDREKLSRFGLNHSQVASIIRTAVVGNETSTYRVGKDEFDIIVRLEEKYRNNKNILGELNIITPTGEVITLSQIATFRLAPAYNSIKHISQNRIVTIQADVDNTISSVEALKQVKEALSDFNLPDGYSIQYTGEEDDRKESQAYLSQSFLIALFLIFIILVTQFNSLSTPFIILSSVFVSLMGVFLGLIIHGRPFSILMGGIGTISLAGVVVNNAIVLVDYIKQLRAQGMDNMQSIIVASQLRIRPVLLTALTTILGLMPILLKLDINLYRPLNQIILFGSESGTFWFPMALAVAYGLGIATLLTLIFIPVLYHTIDNAREYIQRKYISIKSFSARKSSIN